MTTPAQDSVELHSNRFGIEGPTNDLSDVQPRTNLCQALDQEVQVQLRQLPIPTYDFKAQSVEVGTLDVQYQCLLDDASVARQA